MINLLLSCDYTIVFIGHEQIKDGKAMPKGDKRCLGPILDNSDFVVYVKSNGVNEKGELIYAWISTDEPFIIKDGLEAGKYTLTEILAPEGYELNKESVTFTVNADGTVNGDIVMYNKPQEVVEVPSTSSFKTMTTSLIGLLIIGFGSLVIYRNYKKNEEV